MITIDFGGDEQRSNDNITTKWLNKAYHRRVPRTNVICVNIHIREGNVNLSLPCGMCSGPSGKPASEFNRQAQHIIEQWRKHGLDKDHFAFGQLEAFLKKLFRRFGMKLK